MSNERKRPRLQAKIVGQVAVYQIQRHEKLWGNMIRYHGVRAFSGDPFHVDVSSGDLLTATCSVPGTHTVGNRASEAMREAVRAYLGEHQE